MTLQTRLKDAQINLADFQSNQLPAQYELTKTQHEKKLLAEQVQYLEEQLTAKSAAERALRAETTEKIEQLEYALKTAESAAAETSKANEALQVTITETEAYTIRLLMLLLTLLLSF